jgi:hypothetical protein
MTQVGLLTVQEKDLLIGQQYTYDSYFNPIQDIDDNWIISLEEMEYCTNSEFIWVKNLPIIDYKPRPEIP